LSAWLHLAFNITLKLAAYVVIAEGIPQRQRRLLAHAVAQGGGPRPLVQALRPVEKVAAFGMANYIGCIWYGKLFWLHLVWQTFLAAFGMAIIIV